MEWISVEDRLPEDDTNVLVLFNGEIKIGFMTWEHPTYEETWESYKYWDESYHDGQGWEHWEITHWMPLPEPPKEGE